MKRIPSNYRPIRPGAIKIDLPNCCQQEIYTCGPSALMSICAYYGVGPEEEEEVVADMGIDETGTDPEHFVRAAEKYRLQHKHHRRMTIDQLRACLDQRHAVLLMVQAWRGWSKREKRSYEDQWGDGHWLVAIGYDKQGIYVEDPSLYVSRGYLTDAQLEERWHDIVGKDEDHTDHYGLEIWRKEPGEYSFAVSARIVD